MKSFWLIGYVGLVWDRTITAFVPMSVLRHPPGMPVSFEVMDRLRFLDEAEADAQIAELRALGLNGEYVTKKEYKCEQIR